MKKRNRILNVFYIPALCLMILFMVLPLINGLRLSFFKWNGYSRNMTFNGLTNYISLLTDKNFRIAFGNTILYGFGSMLLQNILGLAYALFLNMKFKGRSIVRTFVYLPVMISGLVMGYILYFFVQYNHGIFNEILAIFSIAPIDWMANGTRGKIIITLINSWQFVGISMVIYLAGLQGIPAMYYEASALDGASAWKRFRYVTIPLLVPAMSSAVILNLIGGLKLNDVIIAMTNGGPALKTHSLSTYISNMYFSAEKAGYASAVGVFMFLFILVVSSIMNGFFRRKEVEY